MSGFGDELGINRRYMGQRLPGLGELPGDIDVQSGVASVPARPMFPDVQQQTSLLNGTPSGDLGINAPKQITFVTSAFDARPINTQDFSLQMTGGSNRPGDGMTHVIVGFKVPTGKVAIIRRFKISLDPVVFYPYINNSGQYPCTYKLSVDGSTVPYIWQQLYDGIPVSPTQPEIFEPIALPASGFLETYFIAGEGQFVEWDIHVTTPADVNLDLLVGSVLVQGNYLQSRGLPPNYEPGNI